MKASLDLSRRQSSWLFIALCLCVWAYRNQGWPFWWWFLPYHQNLCQNGPPDTGQPNLQCYNLVRNKIAPFKVEQLSRDPDLLLIHDYLIGGNRLNRFRRNLISTAAPSPMYTILTHTAAEKWILSLFKFRVSYIQAWSRYGYPRPVIKEIYETGELMSGLTFDTNDHGLNGQYYLPGGHILPHHDVYPFSDDPENGRRFVTLMFYVSPAEKGGATIFPKMGVRVQGKPGAAIMWYNTFPDGSSDSAASHAGCPVFKGRKIIATFWTRAHGQEFRKPCPADGSRFTGFGEYRIDQS